MKELLKAKSNFRKMGVKLTADKQKDGAGGSWRFAGEDNFLKTIQSPLSECGLEYVATFEAMPELNVNIVVGTLYHIDSGEYIQSRKILETPVPKKDRNGNAMYLDAEIESGKQFGYWSRILGIRLLGLSDIDPEDVQNVPQRLIKSYNTWSKANAQEKEEYKKEFFGLAKDFGLENDMFIDFFEFLGVDHTDEKEKHNSIVQFLRGDHLLDQVETYIEYRRKNQ